MNGGEPATVRDVTQAAVAAFHRDHFGPEGTTLVLAGDFVDRSDRARRAQRWIVAQRPPATCTTRRPDRDRTRAC